MVLPHLYELAPCADREPKAASFSENEDIKKAVESLVKKIYDGKGGIKSDRSLIKAFARQLMEAMLQGYGKDLESLEYGSADFNAIDKLTNNIYQFSAAKNWNELRDMTDALHDGDRIRTFDEYQTITEPIIGKYNRSWLKTEYSQAIAASQCAARWTEFQGNKKDETKPYA